MDDNSKDQEALATGGGIDSAAGLSDSTDPHIWKPNVSAEEGAKKEFLHGDPPRIDWEALRSKLDEVPAVPPLDPVPQWLRLIDVRKKKVVRAPSKHFQYVCLSYTWGNVQEFKTTKSNIAEFGKKGRLSLPEDSERPEGPDNRRLPGTIQDAIDACQRLGKRYLWVDRLCIIQDGPGEHRQAHFDEMGRIYNHAIVTLVAYEGKDARYGLHGISRPLNLGASRNDFWTRSAWMQRGWTYQEAVLSRTMILFTETGVILDHGRDPRTTRKSKVIDFHLHLPIFHGTVSYCEAVGNYTERALGHPGDIINAFSGVCGYLFDQDHQFGMPKCNFYTAMHWFTKSGRPGRRASPDGRTFPTWSWASVKGKIIFPTILPAFAVASWAFPSGIDEHGNASMHSPESDDFPVEYSEGGSTLIKLPVAYFVRLCWGYGDSNSMDKAAYSRLNMTSQEMARLFPSYGKLLSRRKYSTPDPCRPSSSFDLGQFSEQQKLLVKEPGRIFAYSWVSKLRVKPRFHKKKLLNCRIYNQDECVGVCYFDDQEFKRESPAMDVTFFALTASWAENWDMVRSALPRELHHFGLDLPFDGDNRGTHLLSVIAIEESPQKGVFRRAGFGVIDFNMWFLEIDRERRRIVLE